MKGEPNGAIFAFFLQTVTEKLGQQHEMVVVNPYKGSALCRIGYSIGEQFVYPSIRLPWRIIEAYTGLVMEDWPEDAV